MTRLEVVEKAKKYDKDLREIANEIRENNIK